MWIKVIYTKKEEYHETKYLNINHRKRLAFLFLYKLPNKTEIIRCSFSSAILEITDITSRRWKPRINICFLSNPLCTARFVVYMSAQELLW